jgi:hypothetical protein
VFGQELLSPEVKILAAVHLSFAEASASAPAYFKDMHEILKFYKRQYLYKSIIIIKRAYKTASCRLLIAFEL